MRTQKNHHIIRTMENEFIREKIKDKPLNKKKLFMRLGVSALCGLVFGLVACIIFITFSSLYKHVNGENVASSASETEGNDLNVIGSDQKGTENSESQGESNSQIPPGISLSLDDYQNLQNKLYTIGNLANKSIVTINTVTSGTDWFNASYEREGQASGVIIGETTKKILILTEKKMIADANRLSVSFIDDTSADAAVQKIDPNTGLAIVTVEKSALAENTINHIALAEFADTSYVRNGTIVIALGSPLGTNYSILTGNITSTNNEISTLDTNFKVFTTDIVCDKNGSGILINTEGKVVGMAMQDYSAAQAENTLTAIAISDIEPIIKLLKDSEDIPYLGLYVSTVTTKISSAYGLPEGVYIKEVAMDSPAMEAGLQSGDVVTSVNGTKVASVQAYRKALYELTPGQEYEIRVKRKGSGEYRELVYKITISKMQ